MFYRWFIWQIDIMMKIDFMITANIVTNKILEHHLNMWRISRINPLLICDTSSKNSK
jgi:hypothetical protein